MTGSPLTGKRRSDRLGHRDGLMNRATFRGNKTALPGKPCVACGRAMSWRKRWSRSWAEVKYCSDACRRVKAARG